MALAPFFRFATVLATLLLFLPPTRAAAPIVMPNRGFLEEVDFERHVMGLFGRLGCAAGSCHGSFQGKGGFRLSLFGYDPQMDYLALTRDGLGRRINPVDPEHSLLLLKPTGQLPHGGGLRMARNSWQYQLFLRWIRAGAGWEKGSGEVSAVRVEPPEVAFPKSGERAQLKVLARFTDGTEEDITCFCDFRTNDDAVAEVTPLGKVTAVRPGDTAIVISYRGSVLPVRIMVPAILSKGTTYPKVAENSYIDREVFAKLRRLNMIPSPLCTEEEFLRRVTIDTLGSLPSPNEVRAFLADKNLGKRAKKIDQLLAHPLHAALWATKFCDLTGNNTDALEQPQQLKFKRSQMWHEWFRKRLAANMPYDEIVHGVLCATSREDQSPEEWVKQFEKIEKEMIDGFTTSYADRQTLDLFWRRQQNVLPDQWGQKTAAAFMGIRIECAECHKHPFDRWTQTDYRAYANVFGKLAFGISPESRQVLNKENLERRKKQPKKGQKGKQNIPLAPLREIFCVKGRGRLMPDPDTKGPLGARALGGPPIDLKSDKDPRVALYEWLRSPDNPFFARGFANRVWGHYFGIGIVDPVDNFSLANPASNDRLLDALARDFATHKYDIRQLERTILNSRTYQLSAAGNETNQLDRHNYSHSYMRPMMAEVVVDVLNTALGSSEKFNTEAPPGSRAIEIGSSRVNNATVAYMFRIFGRPPRTTACDCERAMEPALPQTLFLMTDPVLLRKIQDGRLRTLLTSKKSEEQILEELFLATLSRLPTAEEKRSFAAYQAKVLEKVAPERNNPPKGKKALAPRKKAALLALFTDTLWALINTREFILNH